MNLRKLLTDLTREKMSLNDFVVENHVTPTLTGNGNYDNQTLNITKPGYYPIGIVGFHQGGTLSSYLHTYAMFLQNQAIGSGQIYYNRRVVGYSGSSTLNATITFKVLWAKLGGVLTNLRNAIFSKEVAI